MTIKSIFFEKLKCRFTNNLNLRNKNLKKQPKISSKLNAKRINLSGNKLIKFKLKNIPKETETLSLSFNQLTEIDCSECPSKLKYLYLTNNKLKELDISNTNIECLFVQNNLISNIKLNDKIKILLISNNKLDKIDMKNLVQLNIDKNNLKSINLNKKIRTLDVSNNPLEKISKPIKQLEILNLKNTKIKNINELDLEFLRTLNLVGLNNDEFKSKQYEYYVIKMQSIIRGNNARKKVNKLKKEQNLISFNKKILLTKIRKLKMIKEGKISNNILNKLIIYNNCGLIKQLRN